MASGLIIIYITIGKHYYVQQCYL